MAIVVRVFPVASRVMHVAGCGCPFWTGHRRMPVVFVPVIVFGTAGRRIGIHRVLWRSTPKREACQINVRPMPRDAFVRAIDSSASSTVRVKARIASIVSGITIA